MRHRRRPITDPPQRGFSLVELVMVMAIIAMLSGIALPRYESALARYRVERAARRIVLDLAAARTEARTSNTSHVVQFGPGLEAYRILEGERVKDGFEVIRLSKAPYHVDVVSANFNGTTSVTFDVYGVPNAGGTVVLQAGDFQKTITLDADTARATMQ